jgi:hypothetical protein
LRQHPISINSAARSILLLALLICATCQICSGYSVLTNEEIVDLLWTDQIKHLLLQKFPGTTEDELRVAHGYAYGGCLIQDLGYYPFGNRFFSDLTHYVRSGDFVETLLSESSDVNEYAFALGALAHYASDITGHPFVNTAVAQEFPKLQAKYGPAVTFEQDKSAHIRTEFGFDVVQVAKSRYTSDAYHNFIGFQVSTALLERSFRKTYGIELKDIFFDENLSIGSYRRAISSIIPEMTRVALLLKDDELVQENSTVDKKKFLYNLTRTDYEREWGKTYQKPGLGARIVAGMFKVVPKVGQLKTLKFQMPSSSTEALYLKSINLTVERYRAYLDDLSKQKLNLPNTDFDTGKPTRAGEYQSTDAAYGKLLDKLVNSKFEQLTDPLRLNILAFYKDPNAVSPTSRKGKEWMKTLQNLDQLKSTVVESAQIP